MFNRYYNLYFKIKEKSTDMSYYPYSPYSHSAYLDSRYGYASRYYDSPYASRYYDSPYAYGSRYYDLPSYRASRYYDSPYYSPYYSRYSSVYDPVPLASYASPVKTVVVESPVRTVSTVAASVYDPIYDSPSYWRSRYSSLYDSPYYSSAYARYPYSSSYRYYSPYLRSYYWWE